MPSFAVPQLRRYNQVVRWQPEIFHQNAMSVPFPDTPPSEKPPEDRLDSWKEIAAYLGRDVTTVQRWEKRELMPVHRHLHDKRGSVYALAPELDAWLQGRRQSLAGEQGEKGPMPDAPLEAESHHQRATPHGLTLPPRR